MLILVANCLLLAGILQAGVVAYPVTAILEEWRPSQRTLVGENFPDPLSPPQCDGHVVTIAPPSNLSAVPGTTMTLVVVVGMISAILDMPLLLAVIQGRVLIEFLGVFGSLGAFGLAVLGLAA